MAWQNGIEGIDRIYLAAPYTNYSDKDDLVERVTKLAAKIYRNGFVVFSPLTMTHPICKTGELPEHYDYWSYLDESIIKLWATQFWVAAFEGWEYSHGCYKEAICAFDKGIPRILVGTNLEFMIPLGFNQFKVRL